MTFGGFRLFFVQGTTMTQPLKARNMATILNMWARLKCCFEKQFVLMIIAYTLLIELFMYNVFKMTAN